MPNAAPVADLAQHDPDALIAHLDEATSDGAIKEAVSRPRDVAGEIVKQAYEQPLHFLMAAGPIWLSRYLTAVPWYGWSIIPALAYREWRQWPSNRWWDPPLDAAFLILGVIGATWRGQRAHRPAPPLRWWRRDRSASRLWTGRIRVIRSGS